LRVRESFEERNTGASFLLLWEEAPLPFQERMQACR
jgi:hypothetical protein